MSAPALHAVLQHEFEFAPRRLPTRALAERLGLAASALVRLLLPLDGGERLTQTRGRGVRVPASL